MLKQGEKRGGNTFGIDSSESYYCMAGHLPMVSKTQLLTNVPGYILTTTWYHAVNDEVFNEWSDLTHELIHEALEKKGLSHPFIYMNDAQGHQKVFAGYGQKELKRLKQVREKYDPQRLWKKGLVGGFKIPE